MVPTMFLAVMLRTIWHSLGDHLTIKQVDHFSPEEKKTVQYRLASLLCFSDRGGTVFGCHSFLKVVHWFDCQVGTSFAAKNTHQTSVGFLSAPRAIAADGSHLPDLGGILWMPDLVSYLTALERAGRQAAGADGSAHYGSEAPGRLQHADETCIRVYGVLHWLHVNSTRDLSYLAWHKSRGRQAKDDIGTWPRFISREMHDRFASYDGYDYVHSIYGVHKARAIVRQSPSRSISSGIPRCTTLHSVY